MKKKFKLGKVDDYNFKSLFLHNNAALVNDKLEKFILMVVMNRDAQYAERGKRPDLMKVLELDAKDLGIELNDACANCNGMSKCHKS